MSSSDVVADTLAGLRRLAKAVVVITSRHEGVRFAMAATAVCELSLDPPSLLICVNQTASIHSALAEGANFCVNILHRSQEDLARHCSGKSKGEERFAFGEWGETDAGVPFLLQAQAGFVCLNEQQLGYGTHRIFVGRVLQAFTNGDVDPLIYVNQTYTGVERPSAAE
jgi:flavin reductase (DIM6/NTAB) family NADH-FMN oxidoreductase RutF